MINSINTSPSFEGKAIVKFNQRKVDAFRTQLNEVARNMRKSVKANDSKQALSDEMLNTLEQKIRHDELMIAGIVPAAKRGNNYNAIIVVKDSDDMLVKALRRVFNNDGASDCVTSYADYVSKSAKK